MRTFDHVIVGTGQATGTLLGGLLGRGESIAIIEGHRIGGTCVNTGCTPTKTLVASARVAHQVRRAPEYGLYPGDLRVDFSAVMARMNEVRHASSSGLEAWITGQEEVSLLREWASFVGPRRVRVGSEIIEGRQIYLNVGAGPRRLELPGLEGVSWLDSSRLLDLPALPEHLVILGGGYVGVELGQVFRRLGSRVTMVERGPQLLAREDEDVARGVQEILEGESIDIRLEAAARRVGPGPARSVTLTIEREGATDDVKGSHLLVAAGRLPNTGSLGLEEGGIHTDAGGYIVVDDHCRTSVEGVWAVGDVNGHGGFTHTAVNDAEIVLDTFRGGSRTLSDRIPVYAVFTDPPLGRVGLTEREALERGHRTLKATRPMSRISRAKEMGETLGFAKLLVDADTDLILGAAVLGPGADEIINMFAAYMYSGLPCSRYRRSVLVHPTISELMPWILDTLAPVDA